MADRPVIVEGWRPGALGFIIGEHGRYYAEHWGFGSFFEAGVASELGAFQRRYDPSRDLLLLAVVDGTILASLVIDGHDPTSPPGHAHLRFFIISETARGLGLGESMLRRALSHVDRIGAPCWLTTFAGLDAARHLYQRHGFRLEAESDAASWGVTVREQLFRRPLPSVASAAIHVA